MLFFILGIVALTAGLCLLPDEWARRTGIIVPDPIRDKKVWQGILFLALALLMLSMRLWPFAILILLVGTCVIGISYWRDKAMQGLEEQTDRPNFRSRDNQTGALPGMSTAEALAVLGLEQDATLLDVEAAYKRLIVQIHPDKGGTDYLATKINQARELLKKQLDISSS